MMTAGAEQVARRIPQYNISLTPRHTPVTMRTLDFEQLYTNIPHDDLVSQLCFVIDMVFDLHPSSAACHRHVLRIGRSRDKCGFVAEGRDQARQSRRNLAYKFISVDLLKECVEYIIRNAFIHFGGKTMQQQIGIPMGIQPGGHFANLYLFAYEFKFVSSLVRSNNWDALHAFRFNACYIIYIYI